MNNKDLIEDIKAKLKASEELPYREGAWERFAGKESVVSNSKTISLRRVASIVAAGIAIAGVAMYMFNIQNDSVTSKEELTQISIPQSINTETDTKKNSALDNENIVVDNKGSVLVASTNSSDRNYTLNASGTLEIEDEIKQLDVTVESQLQHTIVKLNMVKPVLKTFSETRTTANILSAKTATINTLAHQTVNNHANTSEESLQQPKRMSLGNKFELGLYVSPTRTSDKFDVGAGFMLSYALTDKISLRTGTSYNSYSVGVVKDPLQTASTEVVNMEHSYSSSLIVADKTNAFRQEMILPNINAVMGRVDALEIPLELSYDLNKGFYTSAGVSYSAILNQQREAQYVENAGVFSLQDNAYLIPNAAQELNKVQTKTVKSNQENVNTKGFNGFANFSIGKKVDIKNKMSLSVEPFVKVPLGEFRKSDLNYTNSGIRIITTF